MVVNFFRLNGSYFYLVLENTKIQYTYTCFNFYDNLVQDIADNDSNYKIAPSEVTTDGQFKKWVKTTFPNAELNKVKFFRRSPRNNTPKQSKWRKQSKPNIIIPHKTFDFINYDEG